MTSTTLPPDRHPVPAGRELALPKPPGVIRQFWARHPWWADSIVAALYFVPTFLATLVVFLTYEARANGLMVLGLFAICVSGAALLFRRYRPWTALIVIWAMALLIAPFAGISDPAAIPIALYSVAVYRSTRDGWMALAGSAAVGTAAIALTTGIYRTDTIPPFGAPVVASSSQFIVVMLFATLIGINIGNRRRYLAALVDRAAQLARERDQQAQLATAAERARIAREMHDIVSHSLTVMVTLADGSAAAIDTNPQGSAEAMRHVAETGRHALGDMRRMLGVLHEDASAPASGAALEPQPGTGDLPALVDTFRAAGLPVRLSITGEAPDDPGLQLTVYRVVQEALTNALRYARGVTRVEVVAVFAPELLTVTVTDDGRGAAAATVDAAPGAGRGLVGMRERVTLYSGTLTSGPRSGGGWRVAATLLPEPATTPTSPTNGPSA